MRGLTEGVRRLFRRVSGRKPIIHLYCLCWNEERMLPFFFRHYDSIVDRYVVYDNGSTDRSLEMLAAHPRVTVHHFETEGGVKIGAGPAFYESCWHPSRGVADWVIIVDVDEHLHHPNLGGYLTECWRNGVTIIPAEGQEMVATAFPAADAQLSASIRTGIRQPHMDKLCVFRPDAITQIGFKIGRHSARPRGRVVEPPERILKLLHYKYVSAAYVIARFAELGARIPAEERERGWARHYFQEPKAITAMHEQLLAMAKPIEGL